jgi:hypothetical protein
VAVLKVELLVVAGHQTRRYSVHEGADLVIGYYNLCGLCENTLCFFVVNIVLTQSTQRGLHKVLQDDFLH